MGWWLLGSIIGSLIIRGYLAFIAQDRWNIYIWLLRRLGEKTFCNKAIQEMKWLRKANKSINTGPIWEGRSCYNCYLYKCVYTSNNPKKDVCIHYKKDNSWRKLSLEI